jgi:hypothetical protein
MDKASKERNISSRYRYDVFTNKLRQCKQAIIGAENLVARQWNKKERWSVNVVAPQNAPHY